MRVRIVEDCREGHLATGMLGEYEEKVYAVGLNRMTPKITLDDGDIIYGCECWWEEYQEDKSLEQAQEELFAHKLTFLSSFDVVEIEEEGPDEKGTEHG